MRRTTRIGGYLVGIAAGVAAVVWVIKDRLLGPETVPLTPAEAPAFRVAPRPAAPSQSTDDLTRVKGIGPVYRAKLEQVGIGTFAALAAASASTIAQAAAVPDEKAAAWIAQAAQLSAT